MQFVLKIDLAGYANAFTISSQLQRVSSQMWSDGKTSGDVQDNSGDVVGHYEVLS